jgi:nucleotide-binding universal stress UspA family protein
VAREHLRDPGAGLTGPVVVGVHSGQHRAVLREAAALASDLGRELLCASVTADSYLTEWDPAEMRERSSLHPATLDADDQAIVLGLAGAVRSELGDGVDRPWTLRVLAGDPVHALTRLAEEVDARLLVVGAHPRGFGHAIEGWLSGSVAARLAHEQDRPVVVVPVPKGPPAADLLD